MIFWLGSFLVALNIWCALFNIWYVVEGIHTLVHVVMTALSLAAAVVLAKSLRRADPR